MFEEISGIYIKYLRKMRKSQNCCRKTIRISATFLPSKEILVRSLLYPVVGNMFSNIFNIKRDTFATKMHQKDIRLLDLEPPFKVQQTAKWIPQLLQRILTIILRISSDSAPDDSNMKRTRATAFLKPTRRNSRIDSMLRHFPCPRPSLPPIFFIIRSKLWGQFFSKQSRESVLQNKNTISSCLNKMVYYAKPKGGQRAGIRICQSTDHCCRRCRKACGGVSRGDATNLQKGQITYAWLNKKRPTKLGIYA